MKVYMAKRAAVFTNGPVGPELYAKPEVKIFGDEKAAREWLDERPEWSGDMGCSRNELIETEVE